MGERPRRSGAPTPHVVRRAIPVALSLDARFQFLDGMHFDLLHPSARHPKDLADLPLAFGKLPGEPQAKGNDLSLTIKRALVSTWASE